MKKLIFLFLLLGPLSNIFGDSLPFFNWTLLWTGSFSNSLRTEEAETVGLEELFEEATLYNRGDLRLNFPRQDFSVRLLATDKRDLPLTEDDGRAGFNPGLGLYHRGSGSRVLYGVLNEYGLPARVSNIWARGLPFTDSRSPSSSDLKVEPSARDTPATYLYLGLPQNWRPFGIDAFFSGSLDEELNASFGGGLGLESSTSHLRLETFYTRRELPERRASAWFSSSPSLPERDSSIFALALMYNSPILGLATDLAFSETFAYGRGTYGSAALRLGHRPWRLSLSADTGTGRFVDRNGAAIAEGLRLGLRLEHFLPRSGLLRIRGSLRGESPKEIFERINFSAYYRHPGLTAAQRRALDGNFSFRFSRASISFNRDARNPEKISDSFSGMTAFQLGPINTVFNCTLSNTSMNFDSLRFTCEIGIRPITRLGTIDLGTRVGYTFRAERDPVFEFSANCSVRPGRWGRIGIRIASPDFPGRWNYSLSWRLII
ncbi:MAG: hypothetical protein FWG77_05450 [Treponema sp.]|nr:hypothetical protein [Treponema sp.]